MYNKTRWKSMVLRAADAVNSDRWEDSVTGSDSEVDFLIDAAYSRECRRILNVCPSYWTHRSESFSDSDGKYDKSNFNGSFGRFYRILGVVRDGVVYQQETYQQNLNSTEYTPTWYTWWDEGEQIIATGVNTSKNAKIMLMPVQPDTRATFVINYIPPDFRLLAPTYTVEFPDGHEMVPILEAAALLLGTRAGAEFKAASELKQLAEEYREDMLSDLARISTQAKRVAYDDDPHEWGG